MCYGLFWYDLVYYGVFQSVQLGGMVLSAGCSVTVSMGSVTLAQAAVTVTVAGRALVVIKVLMFKY